MRYHSALAKTLLIGSPRHTWREWIRENLGEADLLCLDPADATHATPTQLTLFQGHRPKLTRLYGSLDAQRQPHAVLAFLAQAMTLASDDLVVQLFVYRQTPVMRQTALLAAQMLHPDQILIPRGSEAMRDGWPIGPDEVDLEKTMPAMIQHAQRKAQWLKLFENCAQHQVDLRRVSIQGARLGCGTILSQDERKKAGLESTLHAEVAGGTLFAISDIDLDDNKVAIALDFTGCSKVVFAEPGAYRNLICAFANQSGEDFGTGFVQEIDWRSMRARILCTAVEPAPVRILRLGALRVDAEGREISEIRPWQL